MGNFEKRQEDIFSFIKEYISIHHIPPSIREICQKTNISSTSVVHKHLKSLEEKGLIKRTDFKKRYIEINEDKSEVVNVPIVGTVRAGEPIFAYESIEGYFPMPSDMAKEDNFFMLKIQGDSMKDAGIFDGDLVLVNKECDVQNNDIVIALIDENATCKRFVKKDDKIYLMPENKDYKPIVLNSVYIIGKVVGLYRNI